MNKLPFYIGNIFACLVYGSERRAVVRGWVNMMLYRRKIAKLIKNTYNEKLKNIKFIRQRTLNRVCLCVNDKYYVKIFRNLSNEELKNFENICNYISKYINVNMPKIIVDNKISMYVSEHVLGRPIDSFSREEILLKSNKIQKQVKDFIQSLQSIDVINKDMRPLQKHREEIFNGNKKYFAHFDLNEGNLFFDDDLNLISVIDWDALYITEDKNIDMKIFMKFWNRFIKSL